MYKSTFSSMHINVKLQIKTKNKTLNLLQNHKSLESCPTVCCNQSDFIYRWIDFSNNVNQYFDIDPPQYFYVAIDW